MINLTAQLPTLPNHQVQQLEAFLNLLNKWNKVYNLTSITKPKEMVTHHILDSLSISPYLHGKRLIDVGTGAGLPGIPLAITYPDKHFTLLDSNSKKTRFCQQVIAELGLKNVAVVHGRVAEYQPELQFDSVISRAFSSLQAMFSQCCHLLALGGKCLAMKGKSPSEEIAALPDGLEAEVLPLAVPGLGAERCLVVLVPSMSFYKI